MSEPPDDDQAMQEWQYQIEEIADLWCPPNKPWVHLGCGIGGSVLLGLIALPYLLGKAVHIRKPWTAQGPLIVTGSPALAFGVSLAAIAFFIHFLCFWRYRSSAVCGLGKLVSFILWVLSFGYYMWGLIA